MTIQELWCYPVKSLGGYPLAKAQLTARGFADDRRWMLVDPQGQFYTQREYAHFAEWIAMCAGDGLTIRHRNDPGRQLIIERARPTQGKPLRVTVWDDTVEALPVGPDADRWLSEELQLPCRLVYMPPHSMRPVDPDYARPGEIVSFADGFPYLVTNTASLRELERRLDRELSMTRFRPNIVIATDTPFAEDHWQHLRIGGEDLRLPKPCGRCQVVTIDQETGARTPEVLTELSHFRRRGNKVIFGMNACWENADAGGDHFLEVGAAVQVIASAPGR